MGNKLPAEIAIAVAAQILAARQAPDATAGVTAEAAIGITGCGAADCAATCAGSPTTESARIKLAI